MQKMKVTKYSPNILYIFRSLFQINPLKREVQPTSNIEELLRSKTVKRTGQYPLQKYEYIRDERKAPVHSGSFSSTFIQKLKCY